MKRLYDDPSHRVELSYLFRVVVGDVEDNEVKDDDHCQRNEQVDHHEVIDILERELHEAQAD